MDSNPLLPVPHRPPYLFVTRMGEMGPEAALCSYEFPRQGDTFALRMFPELLTVEAMAQAALAFEAAADPGVAGQGSLTSVDRVRFSGRVRPGDRLTIKIRRKYAEGELVTLDGEVWVHHRMISQAEIVLRRGSPSSS